MLYSADYRLVRGLHCTWCILRFMSEKIDQLYQQPQSSIDGFRFDANVADVFADMIKRSVPGYSQILALLPSLVRQGVGAGIRGHYYDLGCSLGAGVAAIAQGLAELEHSEIIGIDNSAPMLKAANLKLAGLSKHNHVKLSLIHDDICDAPIDNAAMILMNFTLQFLPIGKRAALISRCYDALNSGGRLVLSEKIRFDQEHTNQAMIELHHQFKQDQGYSQMEISQKRDAIETVLIPETLTTHTTRLKEAGFSVVTPWIQNLQFVSILAIK